MPTERFQPIVQALLLVAGCVLFGAGVQIEHAQAQQFAPPPPPQLPPPQAPVFNPSSPYTVPQPSYRPLAPATPSAVPGYVIPSSVNGRLSHTAGHTHRRTSVAKTRSMHHRGRHIVVSPTPESYSYYESPFGYGYGCAWRRAWDGYWFRTSPCS
jgi:hypothetical protein